MADREDTPWREIGAGVLLGFAYLVAAATGSDQLGLGLALVGAALGFASPFAGLAMLALVVPMREVEVLPPIYPLGLVGFATAFGCLVRLAGQPRSIRIHPGIILVVGYCAYTLVSTLPWLTGYSSSWFGSAVLQTLRICLFVAFYLIAYLVFLRRSPGPFLAIGLLGATLAALLVLMSFYRVGPVDAVGGLLSPAQADVVGSTPLERAVGGFSNANYLGFFAAQATLLAIGRWPLTARRWRPLLIVSIAILGASLLLSFSRSGQIAFVTGLVVLVALRRPRLALVLVIVALAVSPIIYPAFLDARTNGATARELHELARSENWRRLAAGAGITLFTLHPVFGTGYGVFNHLSPPYIGSGEATYSHNAYIQVLAEQGIVGVAFVAGIVLTLLHALWTSVSPYRAVALAMVAAYLVQSFFINSTQSIQISGLMWIVVAAGIALGRRADGPTLERVP